VAIESIDQTSSHLKLSNPDSTTLVIHLTDDWRTTSHLAAFENVCQGLETMPSLNKVLFDASGLTGWDSKLLTFVLKVRGWCDDRKVDLALEGLPGGVQRLLHLALAVPERQGARKDAERQPFFPRVGEKALQVYASAGEMLAFLGSACVAFGQLLKGKASFRRSDLMLFVQESGVQAFGIVSLVSILVGLIFAFIGAIQLKTFGAQIYVADLVGIAMVRVMGAVMAGIIMAGRTGANYAAQLGTMQVNEEIDALQTLGISPMEFLVLPRMMALILMMPLLCVYADIMGILGGLIVGVTMLDLNPVVYLNETKASFNMTNLWIGLIYSAMFGVIIALSGCLRGIQCGRSASAVGDATTSAVVTGIVSIIIATAILTVIFSILNV